MKILIYTSMWQRHQISELFCLGIQRFIDSAPPGFEVSVGVVVSDEASAAICSKFCFNYCTFENSPLGKKWNQGLDYFFSRDSYDYVMIMGDDDLISSEAWKFYEPALHARIDYFGFNSLYFHSVMESKSIKFIYNSHDKLIGCGRFISNRALKKAGFYSIVQFNSNFKHGHYTYQHDEIISLPSYQAEYMVKADRVSLIKGPFFNLWSDKQEKGLDNESEMRLLMSGFYPHTIDIPYPLMTDVKAGTNINNFEKFVPSAGTPRGSSFISGEVETSEALSFISEREREQLVVINESVSAMAAT